MMHGTVAHDSTSFPSDGSLVSNQCGRKTGTYKKLQREKKEEGTRRLESGRKRGSEMGIDDSMIQ